MKYTTLEWLYIEVEQQRRLFILDDTSQDTIEGNTLFMNIGVIVQQGW